MPHSLNLFFSSLVQSGSHALNRLAIVAIAALCVTACTTSPSPIEPQNTPPSVPEIYSPDPAPVLSDPVPVSEPEPIDETINDAEREPYMPPPIPQPLPAPTVPTPVNPQASAIATLKGWRESDVTPALVSFKRSCKAWATKKPSEALNAMLPEYGTYGDWTDACTAAEFVNVDYGSAHDFFEQHFEPLYLPPPTESAGLLTGYYQPEIEVRRRADAYFNEPILAVPKSEAAKKLPRSKISAETSRVIAYGRPMDVFFMQIQGSGHIRFPDGATVRAAYAGNNGYNYKSIGGVLIKRGELTKDKSSKRDIENWMARAGPEKARELMNENKRYIFFKEQKIEIGEGPNGAMRVPLTSMGSMAVDPRYHPYGALIWLGVKLPMQPGDYRGTEQGVLLSAQDTGKAIRGPLRGDIYFGSGTLAGELAGVMKHKGTWSVFLPRALAKRLEAERQAVS